MIAADEAELVPHFERLIQAACLASGQWASTVLVSGWKFEVMCTKNGNHAIRFWALAAASLEWVDFLAEANRCARMLGTGNWKMEPSERKSFFEVAFLAPAHPPALSKEFA